MFEFYAQAHRMGVMLLQLFLVSSGAAQPSTRTTNWMPGMFQ